MGLLQIGKKKGRKKSSEQQLMIRASSKKSSSSASTSSSSPASPVNDFGPFDNNVAKRKSGLFRASFMPRRATFSSSSSTASAPTSRFLLNNKTRASKSNSQISVASAPDYHPETTTVTRANDDNDDDDNDDNTNQSYKIAPVVEKEDPTTPTRNRVSVLSSLKVLPAGLSGTPTRADDTSTSTYQLNFDEVEVREEESDAHYSPSPRRTLRYDDDNDGHDEVYGNLANGINDESFEIIMSELDTPVMDNRALQQQQLTPTGTTVTTTSKTSTSMMDNTAMPNSAMGTDVNEEDDDDVPFDAKEEARRFQQLNEDPTISDLEATENESPQRQELEARSEQEQQQSQIPEQQQEQLDPNLVTPDTVDNTSHDKALPQHDDAAATAATKSKEQSGYYKSLLLGTPAASSVRKRLIDVFNCVSPDDTASVVSATGTTVPYQHHASSTPRKIPMMDFFYDTVCGVPDVTKMTKKRPFYNEQFALDFLRKMIFEGVTLLYLQLSNSTDEEKEDDWNGESITMKIVPGVLSASLQLPRLEWSTWGGGWSHPEVRSTSLDLLQIHSVLDNESVMNSAGANYNLDQSLEGEETANDHDGDVFAFTITSEQGEVYIFEASSENERDQVVCGLKNIMARLSYQLIAGDDTMASELFQTPKSEDSTSAAELPPLVTSRQAVQDMTQDFLDW